MADREERLTHRLALRHRDATVAVLADGDEIVRFGGVGRAPAVHAWLVLANGKLIPVTRSPSAVVGAVTDAAAARRCDPAAWSSVLAARLAQLCGLEDPHSPAPPLAPASARLGRVVLAATHPALVRALAAGLDPAPDVAPWASPALRSPRAAAAGEILFARRPARNVTAALARLLSEPADGHLAWWPLAAAVAASGRVEQDDLALVLSFRLFAARAPASEDVEHLRRLFSLFDRTDVVRLVHAGLASAGALDALAGVAARAADVARLPRADRPRTLDDLVRFARSFTRTAAAPPDALPGGPPPAGTPPAALPRRRAGAPPPPPGWRRAREAPATARPTTPATEAAFQRLRTALDGRTAGDLILEVPRSAAELRTWASILGNCLAGFDDAVRRRRSLVIGVRRDGRLEAALEIDPAANRLRQFHGPRNRPPAPATADAVIDALRTAGVRVS